MRPITRFIFSLSVAMCFTFSGMGRPLYAQDSAQPPENPLPRGQMVFNITRGKVELENGLYRSRLQGIQPFKYGGFVYQAYFPFQWSLIRREEPAADPIMKINMLVFLHHSTAGNYGLGLSTRISWLLVKKLYLSYQIGLGWFEANSEKNDGLNNRGLNFQHQLSLSRQMGYHWGLSLNVLHVSNGNMFGKPTNIQDMVALGAYWQFR